MRVTVSAINLAWSTPNAGFHAETESAGPDRVIVEFEGSRHDSKIEIWIENGEVRQRTDEHGEDN